jgi:hypothetical protein
MPAFISIKGLFEACSRVAIQAHLRKLSFIICITFLTHSLIGKNIEESSYVSLNSISEPRNVTKSPKSVSQVKVVNRLISGRTVNVVTPTITISADNTRIAEGQTSTITATLSTTSSFVTTINFAPSGTSSINSDHQFSLMGYNFYASTVAGTGVAGSGADQLNVVHAILDNSGNIYIADANNHRVQKWAPGATSGITVAGTGVAGSGSNQLNFPWSVALDNLGNLVLYGAGIGIGYDLENTNNYRHFVFTTAKGLHYFTDNEMFLNKVKCFAIDDFKLMVDGNVHFWDKCRSIVDGLLKNTK